MLDVIANTKKIFFIQCTVRKINNNSFERSQQFDGIWLWLKHTSVANIISKRALDILPKTCSCIK